MTTNKEETVPDTSSKLSYWDSDEFWAAEFRKSYYKLRDRGYYITIKTADWAVREGFTDKVIKISKAKEI